MPVTILSLRLVASTIYIYIYIYIPFRFTFFFLSFRYNVCIGLQKTTCPSILSNLKSEHGVESLYPLKCHTQLDAYEQ